MGNFRNLVFEGGGVRGIAYGGALTELDRLGILPKIKRVAGASAGAITAVLLAVGYTHKEVSDIVAKTNFKDFADAYGIFGFYLNVLRMIFKYGWHRGKYFRKWIGELIKAKTGSQDTTFKELYESKLPGKKELYLVGTNLSAQKTRVFSHEAEHTPNLKIREAARMSMSIPLYFECVRWEDTDDIMVDGGVVRNYPLNIFDNEKYLYNHQNGKKVEYDKSEGYLFNYETLGFRLDTRDEIRYNSTDWSNVPKNIINLFRYVTALGAIIYEMANKRHIHTKDWKRTIFIDTKTVRATNFKIKKKEIAELIESGREGVNKYFEWRNKNKRLKHPV